MGKAQRDRGKRGERLLVQLLKRFGWNARRGVQFAGGPNSPDVVSEDLNALHFECKFTEKLSINAAIAQAEGDGGANKLPIVAWKRNGKPFYFILAGKDFLNLLDFAVLGGFDPKEKYAKPIDKSENSEDTSGL